MMLQAPPLALSTFTPSEWRALRVRYGVDRDLCAAHELAHLCFLRWLHQTGRLVP